MAGGRAAAAAGAPGPLGERRGFPAPPAGHRRHRGHRRGAAGGVAVDAAGLTTVLLADPRGRRNLDRGRAGVRAAAPGPDVRARGTRAPPGAHAGRLGGRRLRGLLRRGAGRAADTGPGTGDRLGAPLRRPGHDPARAHHHAGQRRGRRGVLPRLCLRRGGRGPAGAYLDRGLPGGHPRPPPSGLPTPPTPTPPLVLASLPMGLLFAQQRRITGGIQAPILTHVVWSTLMLRYLPPLFARRLAEERSSPE